MAKPLIFGVEAMMLFKEIVEDPQPMREPVDRPEPVKGPLYGVPVAEVRAWVESLTTDLPLPTPQARQVR